MALWLKNSSATMVCPFLCVVITPSGLVGGVGVTTDGFREYRMSLENEKFDKLIACVESLNNVISNDESLGDGFCIGHSYFCNLLPDTIDDQVLSGIVEYELIPLLKEYWFDEPTKVKDWSSNLRSAIK